MLPFGRMKALQKFASILANVHNHFNLERHLVQTHLQERHAVAPAEWQILASYSAALKDPTASCGDEFALD